MKQDIQIKEAIEKKSGDVTIHGWVHRERERE
jgi:aspartyl/asparaginyl-tRNA synthetase